MPARYKWNWSKLKREFLLGEWVNISSFLRDKGIPLANFKQAAGWLQEKNELEKRRTESTKTALVEKEVDSIADVRSRQARLAKFMQLKAAAKLKNADIETVDEARRMAISGMREERKALDMEGGKQSLTQINIKLPQTNLDKLVEKSDYEGILKLIADLKREKSRRLGTATSGGSTTEVQEGEAV